MGVHGAARPDADPAVARVEPDHVHPDPGRAGRSGAGHDGREEEELLGLLVAGVVLPVGDAVWLGGVVGRVEALFHPVEQTIVVFEGNVVEVADFGGRGGGEILVEEDVLDEACAEMLVESYEWIVARRRRRTGVLEVRACLHVLQEAGVHHHVEMAVRLGGWLVAGCMVVVVM